MLHSSIQYAWGPCALLEAHNHASRQFPRCIKIGGKMRMELLYASRRAYGYGLCAARNYALVLPVYRASSVSHYTRIGSKLVSTSKLLSLIRLNRFDTCRVSLYRPPSSKFSDHPFSIFLGLKLMLQVHFVKVKCFF